MSPEHTPIRIALAGNPNCGKTALFNALTGAHQQVGNYPGVTVERIEGKTKSATGRPIAILDLPGTYSLDPRTPDEAITRDVLLGLQEGEPCPEVILAVADATSLKRNLAFVLELKNIGLPLVVAINMMDLAQKQGEQINFKILSEALGCVVVPTIAVKKIGIAEILSALESTAAATATGTTATSMHCLPRSTPELVQERFVEVDRILERAVTKTLARAPLSEWSDRIDRVILHPLWGSVFLITVLGLMFQAVFTWAETPMSWIDALFAVMAQEILTLLPGALGSLLADGVIAGVGSVVIFLPQILLLFLFILLLEDSGYMARAAFLMDKIMGKAGLHGRAFIPLLSSFACAVPGIMAARTIENKKDRLITILVSPLITCSARLPVYSLLIAAFIPNHRLWGPVRLQGGVMFSLYFVSTLSALLVAALLKKTIIKGPRSTLLLELPTYKWPSVHNIFHGLAERALVFIKRVGTVILGLSILIWFASTYPKPPVTPEPHSDKPAILYSFAGQLGSALEPVVRPLGFNWQIAVALIPGFAAREIMVGVLGTVYAVEKSGNTDPDAQQTALVHRIAREWSLATAISLLVWYIYSCQCISTLAVTRRETNSWRWPAIMFFYMTALAYLASFIVFQSLKALGFG